MTTLAAVFTGLLLLMLLLSCSLLMENKAYRGNISMLFQGRSKSLTRGRVSLGVPGNMSHFSGSARGSRWELDMLDPDGT